MLTLTDEHIYLLDDKPLDGVTSVIREAGLMPSYKPKDLEWYLAKGTAIHKATELFDKGTLDESTVDPRIIGYLESWQKLSAREFTGIEVQLADAIYGYAGTIDRLPLLDIKSGAPEKWHKIQLGAYYGLCKANDMIFRPSAMAVYLQEDGAFPKVITYTIKEIQDALKIFLSALVVVRARKEMGLI